MADKLVSQDPTLPGVFKVNGPVLTNGQFPLTALSTSGAALSDAIVFNGANWAPGTATSSDTASNLGAGSQVFKSKVGADFQFRSLVAGAGISVTQNANDLTIANTITGTFSEYFESSPQVITAAGALTIAHGMTGAPKGAALVLTNASADQGYSPGDVMFCNLATQLGTSGTGTSYVIDATNIYVRFGSNAGSYTVVNKTTGANADIANVKWTANFRVWR